jgi:tetratricopeptide (TPR) repeat protein
MPHVINGIGTWYWGKRNVVGRQGICDQCGAAGTLQSYDTTLFFVILFLPIIPLKKYHVAQECPRCKRHRAIKLSEWETKRRETVMQAVQGCQAAPRDEAKAVDAIELAGGFEHTQALEALATFVQREQPRSAKAHQALGMAWKNVGRSSDATDALRTAHELDPATPDLARQLAVHEFQHGDPAEGVALIDDVLTGKSAQDLGLAFLAVESFQAHGRHDEALATLNRMQGAYAQLAQDKDFLRYQKVSTKHLGSSKKITHGLIATGKAVAPAHDTHIRNRLALIIGPALILLALGGYLFAAFRIGHGREVWLVNGQNEPYTATLNGEPVVLSPSLPVKFKVAMGDVAITSQFQSSGPPRPAGPDTTVRIFESFLARPFSRKVFVINPDMNAVLEVETATYMPPNSSSMAPLPGDGYTFQTGAHLHTFPGGRIQQVFTPFPQKMTLSGNSPQQFRRLSVFIDANPITTHAMLADQLGAGPANDRLVRMLQADPARIELYDIARIALTHEAIIETVQPALDVRPILLEAHRAYQTAKEALGELDAMHAKYAALLAQQPEDPDLKYLLARMTKDVPEADRLLREAATHPSNPSAMASMALASRLLERGEFAEALPLAEAAFARLPTHPHVIYILREVLSATVQHQRVLDQIEVVTNDPSTRAHETISILARMGKPDEARAYLESVLPSVAEEVRATYKSTYEGVIWCALGDDAKAAQSLIDCGFDPTGLLPALMLRDLTKIREGWATGHEGVKVDMALSVAIAGTMLGDEQLAREALANAIAYFKTVPGDGAAVVALLEGPCPSLEAARLVTLDVALKAQVLVLVGQRCEAIRPGCFALAQKLNYKRHFTSSLIDEATRGKARIGQRLRYSDHVLMVSQPPAPPPPP